MTIPATFILDVGKLGYLLRPRVKDDKSKYLARAGFSIGEPGALESAIRLACGSADAALDRINEYGSFYTLRATLIGPAGVGLDACLVFQLRTDNAWSFVTLYPYKE